MSDENPFITPDDPVGGWNLPFERIGETQADVEALVCDSVSITAAVSDTPLGPLPVLLFDFSSSHDGPLPRLMFITTPDVLRNVRSLVNQSVAAALDATAKRKGKPWA